jgi:hypothetical protein
MAAQKNPLLNMDIELAFNSDLHQWNDKQILSLQNMKQVAKLAKQIIVYK